METRAPVSLLRGRRFKWGAGLVATFCAAAVLVLWLIPSRQSSGAPGVGASEQLASRGYTDAPAGTAVIGGNPWAGGAVLVELRIKNDQKVKRGEIIAVLSNYSQADVSVRTAEAQLEKAERKREAMVSGFRHAAIRSRGVSEPSRGISLCALH